LQGLRTSNGIFNDEYPSISGNVTIFQDGATWKIKIENNPFYSNETLNILYSICNGLNVSGDMQVNDTGPIVTGNLYKYQLIIGSINYTSNFSNDLLTIFRNNATTGGYTLQDP
jgi:hypothetical protein